MPRGSGTEHSGTEHSPPPPTARAAWRLAAWGAALLALGGVRCQEFLEDHEYRVLEPPPVVEDPPPPDLCTAGPVRCQGPALQLCKENRQGYRTVRVCSSAALCNADSGACEIPTCLAGSYECLGAVLRVCDDDGAGWTTLTDCMLESRCNASLGRCTDQACSSTDPADTQCNGDSHQRCLASGWQTTYSCPDALCRPGADECQPLGCRSDQLVPFRCENEDFLRCRDDRTGFELVETCLNAAHCTSFEFDPEILGSDQIGAIDLDRLSRLGCNPPTCKPGRFACEGTELSRCNGNRRGFDLVETCASPGRCDAQAGVCRDQPCLAGQTQCSGQTHQECQGDAWVTDDTCEPSELCDHASGCSPAVCEVTEYHCEGRSLERCNINGDGWIPVRDCETEALCDPDSKRCNLPVCEPGQRRCERDGRLLRCAEGRHEWQLETDCAAAAGGALQGFQSGLCDLTRGCLPQATCESGSFRCNGQALERCLQDFWFPYARCATSELCDPAGVCNPPACDTNEGRCVTAGAAPTVARPGEPTLGLTLEVCNPGRTGFETVRDCGPDELCDGTHQQCDLCRPPEPVCYRGRLHQCSADGQEREFERNCPAGCDLVEGVATCLPGGN